MVPIKLPSSASFASAFSLLAHRLADSPASLHGLTRAILHTLAALSPYGMLWKPILRSLQVSFYVSRVVPRRTR